MTAELAGLMEPVVRALLGAPNERQSRGRELRFGNRGSISVDCVKGTFFDFESNEGGGVLNLIEQRLGLTGRDAFAWMRDEGIIEDGAPGHRPNPSGKPVRSDKQRTEGALRVWRDCRPAVGTLVEVYLGSRGLTIPLPPTLRFHRGLQHRSGTIWPAMVAAVTMGGERTPVAVHRTFLAPGGTGKAPVEPNKMTLGPCRGGAVRLAAIGDTVMVGEGIETYLAAMSAMGMPAWAALSTSGLRTLVLPDCVRDVIILADGDDAGEAAARDAASQWKREGRRVRIARPPRGCDFNDVLGQPEEAA
jgi:hypothetical protein